MMSVLILNKEISRTKWVALGLLTAGVACVQISSMPSAKVCRLYGVKKERREGGGASSLPIAATTTTHVSFIFYL
jgi:hypothetical protein